MKLKNPVTEAVYHYKAADGQTAFSVRRVKCADTGEKEFVIFHEAEGGKVLQKLPEHFKAGNKPLYDLPLVMAAKYVLIHEGEKSAEAGRELCSSGEWASTTFSSGSNSVMKTDYAPLKDKKAIMIPDNDAASRMAMAQLSSHLASLGVEHFIFDVAVEFPDVFLPPKWDVADPFPEALSKQALIDALVKAIDRCTLGKVAEELFGSADDIEKYAVEAAENMGVEVSPKMKNFDVKKVDYKDQDYTPKFKVLGHNNQTYYFLPRNSKQITALNLSQLSKRDQLIGLADVRYWKRVTGMAQGKLVCDDIDALEIGSDLQRRCTEIGVYREENKRGRGVWADEGRVVINLGEKLFVDGMKTDHCDIESQYIYTYEKPIAGVALDHAPLTSEEGMIMARACVACNWDYEVSGEFLAGWIANAMVCGALRWRPHIWITGHKGTGKTWIVEKLLQPIFGSVDGLAYYPYGTSTAAGVRGLLQHDSLPVIFDEAEQEGARGEQRMQEVLEAMRLSSSQSPSQVYKGTQGQGMRSYSYRSMYCLSSIMTSIRRASDASRIAILDLKRLAITTGDDRDYVTQRRDLFLQYANGIDKGFGARLFARMTKMIHIHLQNVETFSKAFADIVGDMRDGDQYGTLLAGRWTLTNDTPAKYDEAADWIRQILWDHYIGFREEVSEDKQVISMIMMARVRVETHQGSVIERTVGELLAKVANIAHTCDAPADNAEAALRRVGIKVDGKHNLILFAITKEGFINDLVKGTIYGAGWHGILKRNAHAKVSEPTSFVTGVKARAVSMPIREIFQVDSDDEMPISPMLLGPTPFTAEMH